MYTSIVDSNISEALLFRLSLKGVLVSSETKILINDILQPNIANEDTFDVNSKLKKIDDLLTLISKSNVQEQSESSR